MINGTMYRLTCLFSSVKCSSFFSPCAFQLRCIENAANMKVANLVSKLASSRQVPSSKLLVTKDEREDANYIKPTRINSTTKYNAVNKKKTHSCDKIIMDLVRTGDLDKVEETLIYFENLQFFPSRKTLLILASVFARNGDVNKLEHIQRVCQNIYPKEFEWMMGYRHYSAEAMWKNGQIVESIQNFKELFQKNISQRKKLSEMIAYLMRHIFTQKLENYYQLLEQFADSTLEEGFYLPAVHLWSISFMSTDHRAWSVCDTLFDKHCNLITQVPVKFNLIIKNARENNCAEILQRLIEFVLVRNLNNHLQNCLGELLMLQCENESLTAAVETFQYASKMKVGLPAESVKQLLILLTQHKKEIPLSLLRVKYPNVCSSEPNINW